MQAEHLTAQQLAVAAATYAADEYDFWRWQAMHPDGAFVAGGRHYRIGDEDERFKGYGGRRWVIRYHDGRTVETTNLWHQGEIPAELRGFFPDIATLEAVPLPALIWEF